MIKNKRFIRVVIIITSILIAIILYISAFDIDDFNMAFKLREHLENEEVTIIRIDDISEHDAKDLIVYFDTNKTSGVSLLHKGLNGNYVINDTHQTNKEIDGVSFLIDGRDHSIFFGKSDKMISQLKFMLKAKEGTHDINSQYIFITEYGRQFDGSVEISYVDNTYFKAHQVTLQSSQGSSWKGIFVLIRSVLIVLLSILFTSILSKKFKDYTFDEYDRLPTDGQRVKQFWPR